MQFKRYILLYTLIPLLILTIAATYYRFMVLHDYVAAYEIDCDPVENSCFVGCEDEECTKHYYFAEIQRNAADLVKLCGDSIVGCESANYCSFEENECSVIFCDSNILGNTCHGPGRE